MTWLGIDIKNLLAVRLWDLTNPLAVCDVAFSVPSCFTVKFASYITKPIVYVVLARTFPRIYMFTCPLSKQSCVLQAVHSLQSFKKTQAEEEFVVAGWAKLF